MNNKIFIIMILCMIITLLCSCDLSSQSTTDNKDSLSTSEITVEVHKYDCNKVDQPLSSQIKIAFANYLSNTLHNEEIEIEAKNIIITNYFGEYNNCHFVMLTEEHTLGSNEIQILDVAGYEITFGGRYLYVYAKEKIYTINEAYDKGIITKADIYNLGYDNSATFRERYASP